MEMNNRMYEDEADDINGDEKSRKTRSTSSADRKQVSRNISMVLENLLMSYENSQLPTHAEGSLLLSNDNFIDFHIKFQRF